MDYAKKAASQSNNKSRVSHSQAHNISKEQNLIDRVKSLKISCQPKTESLKPVIHPPFFQRKCLGQTELSNQFKGLNIEESIEEKEKRIKNCLSECESPFIWKPVQTKPFDESKIAIFHLVEKEKELSDEKKFKWRNFILQLVISYELYRAKEVTQALEMVQGLEKMLVDVTSERREWLILGIRDALWHVVTVSKTYLFLEQNLVKEACQLIDKIQPVKTMSRSNKAGIHGIKAAVFMEYGHQGNLNALDQAEKALELDRTSPEWHFLVGKCMGRIRRVSKCHDIVNFKELNVLNKTVQLDKTNASYKVHLADSIRERAFRDYKKRHPKNYSEDRNKLQKAYVAAKHMYYDAQKMRPDCSHILVRCARGMMKLPFTLVDLKFARECIDKAIELAPNNSLVHFIKGLYYERFDTDLDVALSEVKTAAALNNIDAAMHLVKMQHKLKRTDIVEMLETIARMFGDSCRVQVAYTQAGSYLLFIMKDIIGALKYYTKVIDMDPQSYAMMSHKPMFFPLRDPLNMFDVLLEELDTRTDWESFSEEDRRVLKIFRIKLRSHDTTVKTERLSVEKILEMSRALDVDFKSYKERTKKRTHSRQNKRWVGKRAKVTNNKNQQILNQNNGKASRSQEVRGGINVGHQRKGRGGSNQNRKGKERTSSISSASSMDIECLDNISFRPEGVFLKGSTESLYSEKGNLFGHELRDSSMSNRYSMKRNEFGGPRSYSRDSSVCSNSSNEQNESQLINLKDQKAVHDSRYSQSQQIHKSVTEDSKLTVANLKEYGSANSNYNSLPQRMSTMSISSLESENETCGAKKLSVMEKVSKIYQIYHSKYENNQQNQNKKFNKSGSSQSLNKDQNNPNKKTKHNTKPKICRSDSTQSLNVEQENSSRSRFSKGYKPAFSLRDSSVESTRSLSFMPNFSHTNSESDS